MTLLQRQLTMGDGTRIAYLHQDGPAPALVIANGYGGTISAWRDIFARLPHHQILIWDYRGLYGSSIPADSTRLTIGDHVDDLEQLLAAAGIDRFVMAGWSVGVQVALESYRRFGASTSPEHPGICGLLLINGAHERVLQRSFDGKLAPRLVHPLVRAIHRLGPALDRSLLVALRRLSRFPQALAWLSRMGAIVGEPPVARDVMQRILELDFRTYAQLGLLADQHVTDELLGSIVVPTLITAGTRDLISPPRIGRYLASRIPDSKYRELAEATHYVVMEYPQLLADIIANFLETFG